MAYIYVATSSPVKTCFGCNDPNHKWKTDGDVTCPKRALPGVATNTHKNLETFRKRRCLRVRDRAAYNNHSSSVATSNTRRTSPNNVEYLRLIKSQNVAFVRDLMTNPEARVDLQANMNSLQESLPPHLSGARGATPPPGAGAGTTTFTLVQVLTTSARNVLPVPIDSNLPAIELPFRRDFDDTIPKKIVACADTGARASCGNSVFFKPLKRTFLTLSNVLLLRLMLGISPSLSLEL